MRLLTHLMYEIACRFGLASPQAALLAAALPRYPPPGMNRRAVDAVMIEPWRRPALDGCPGTFRPAGRHQLCGQGVGLRCIQIAARTATLKPKSDSKV